MSQREDTGSSVAAKPLLAEIQRLHDHVQQQPAGARLGASRP